MTGQDRKDQAKPPAKPEAPRRTYMPKPPSRADLDQVSREQALISDDWTGEPAGQPGKGEADTKPAPD